jgi:hypothetical protein
MCFYRIEIKRWNCENVVLNEKYKFQIPEIHIRRFASFTILYEILLPNLGCPPPMHATELTNDHNENTFYQNALRTSRVND